MASKSILSPTVIAAPAGQRGLPSEAVRHHLLPLDEGLLALLLWLLGAGSLPIPTMRSERPHKKKPAGAQVFPANRAPQDSRITNSVSNITDETSSSPFMRLMRTSAEVHPNP